MDTKLDLIWDSMKEKYRPFFFSVVFFTYIFSLENNGYSKIIFRMAKQKNQCKFLKMINVN